MRAPLIVVLVVAWATGCGETPTQVIVTFEADPLKAARATTLRVMITTVGEATPAYDETHAVPSAVTFPATVPVVPAGGDATRRFVAVGEIGDASGVFDRVESSPIGFTEGDLVEVTLRFVDDSITDADLPDGPTDAGDAGPDGGDCRPCPCSSDVCVDGVCSPANPAAQVSAGLTHGCARTEDGRIYCWGDNTNGQLGVGDTDERLAPAEVTAVSNVVDLDVGDGFGCAVRDDGVAFCWGRAGAWISFGAGDDVLTPREISNPEEVLFSDVECGGTHSCGRTRSEELYCWGAGDQGQNGRDGIGGREPRRVRANPTAWLAVDAGHEHTCGIRMSDIYCTGDNGEGQSGQGGMVTDQLTPARVNIGESFRAVGLGRDHTCAITFDDRLFCFGRNNFLQTGQMGTGDVTFPQQVGTEMDWVSVSGGTEHTCGIRGEGELYCWGDNSAGQGGREPSPETEVPTRVGSDSDWIDVDGGGLFTCGVRAGGAVYCWGQNSAGQLGVGDRDPRATPTRLCW